MVAGGYVASADVDLTMIGAEGWKIPVGGIIGTYGALGIVIFSKTAMRPLYAFVDSGNTSLSGVVFYVYAR